VYEFIYDAINTYNVDELEKVAYYPRDWFEDTYPNMRCSSLPIATCIWEEGYENIEWSTIAYRFERILQERIEEQRLQEEEQEEQDGSPPGGE